MDIKGDWKKRAVCGLMVLAMALSLLPTSILAADTRSVTDNAIKNGSFEEPAFVIKDSPQWPANNVPGWDTTASDKLIEFGSTRMNGSVPHIHGSPNVPDGYQFAELNADEESTLYQYAATVGGNVYEWGLSHRGRMGIDRMALIIGPKQDEKPAKPNKAGKDQFMRMTDWVRQHASEMGVTVYNNMGCTQKITVYSKKFAANGGFQNDIGDSAFSASPSDVYTEKWNVWIIGTNNNAWGNYGTNSSDYAAGRLAYSCRYAVPDGQTKTVFAFCSYSATTYNNDKTLGNLIDNIHFSLYQTITAAATAGGSGNIRVSTGDETKIGSSMSKLVVADGSTITVQAVEPDDDVQFVGAYVTRQTQNGLKKEFIPATSPSWDKVDRTYTYVHPVEEPADIVLVFIKPPTVVYDANGGQKYVYEPGATEPKNTVSFAEDTGRIKYTSHAAQAPAGCEDTWQFQGWLLARSKTLLPAEHTVTYDKATDTLTFTDNGSERGSAEGGATLIAQWKWRQRFVTASREKNADGTVSDDFRVNAGCGTVSVSGGVCASGNSAITDYFASASERVTVTAAANAGYEFMGWYQQVDGNKYELVSSEPTHSYNVSREGVQTIYARFAPTHTVTYRWTTEEGKCPPEEQLDANNISLPEAGTVIDGGTYYISKDLEIGKTIDGTVKKDGRTVPGKWVFTGWHDGSSDIVIQETELINVTGDRTLTGFWTFEPEAEHSLSYQFADSGSWSPSGSFAQTEEHYRGESVKAASEPARNQTMDGKDVLVTDNVTLYGAWSFKGWQRSDNENTITAGNDFDMPGKNLTLTGNGNSPRIPTPWCMIWATGQR